MSEREVGGTLGAKNNAGEKFMKKAERDKCYGAKDKLYACMRKYDEDEKTVNKCADLRKMFESDCPPSWVTHYDRKFEFENHKKKNNENYKKYL